MNIKETIEDFEQILKSNQKLKKKTPYDDISAHRDLDLDIERCSKAIEALKFQQEYQDRIQKCIERIEKATTICPIGTIVNFSLVNRGESWKDFRYY